MAERGLFTTVYGQGQLRSPLGSNRWRLLSHDDEIAELRRLGRLHISRIRLPNGEEATLAILVAGLLRMANKNGLASVALGLSEGHPWLPFLGGLRTLRYRSQLYLVHWPEGREAAEELVGQVVQIEVACL